MLLLPLTEAWNVLDCPALKEALPGDTETETGTSVTVALALLVVSAALVAVTVTVCDEETVAGAVYTPPLNVPTDGDIFQVTEVLLEPLTVALNVAELPPFSDALVGEMLVDTLLAVREIIALALLVASALLVAVTVTFCDEVMEEGAV